MIVSAFVYRKGGDSRSGVDAEKHLVVEGDGVVGDAHAAVEDGVVVYRKLQFHSAFGVGRDVGRSHGAFLVVHREFHLQVLHGLAA